MSGIYAIISYKKLKDDNIITSNEFVVYSLLSFVYCADLVVSLIAYKKYKNFILLKNNVESTQKSKHIKIKK